MREPLIAKVRHHAQIGIARHELRSFIRLDQREAFLDIARA